MKLTSLETELVTALDHFYGEHEENANIARHLAEQATMLRVDACLPTEERRAPVQSEHRPLDGCRGVKPSGTVSWAEHEKAWREYDRRYRSGQSAKRISERHGFSYWELSEFLGHEPTTWRPR